MNANNLPRSTPTHYAQAAAHLRFVLMETSHVGNIGSAARALKVMGFKNLHLVSPREPRFFAKQEAIALASGALDVLEGAQVQPDLPTALHGTHLSFALTARHREFSSPRVNLRQAASLATQAALQGQHVAFVLGTEKFGLSNEAVQMCSHLVHIETDEHYGSLNLAQALQLAAYEARMALLDVLPISSNTSEPLSDVGFKGTPATHDAIEGLYQHLEHTLVSVNYLDPAEPKKLMSRLRRLFARSGLEAEEVNILRGVCKAILKKISE